ncbi:unnamed protein product [Parnassius apollo]|uniref:(apollo) hypothetical protein n=1 Tax=Parnassius apollo TaxID=110799 RepID=A0A8S3XPI5_PARAO|nr:unnamed protein product [Parnassius apollo]
MFRKKTSPVIQYSQRSATFQSAMKLSIAIGQVFGLNPVIGVFNVDASKMRFTFYSARCVYTIFSILGQGAMLCFCILKYIKDTNTSLSSHTSLAFYSSNFITMVLFLRMAMKWPRLCLQISMTEALSPNFDTTLVKKCNMSCAIVLTLALVEHILSDLAGFAAVIDCQPHKNAYEAFVTQSFPWVYVFLPYNHFVGFLSQLVNIQSTFTWSFADLFIICISFYLISRLEQVNLKIVTARGKNMSPYFWRSVREDYCRAASLVRRIDDVIGALIFISFANNLFFICLQLYNTLKDGINATNLCSDLDAR